MQRDPKVIRENLWWEGWYMIKEKLRDDTDKRFLSTSPSLLLSRIKKAFILTIAK